MLKILRYEERELPKDVRTLLKAPRDVKTFQKCGGDYCYFGIQKDIEQILLHNTLECNCGNLVFSIAGLPLFKLSGTQLWPFWHTSTHLTYSQLLLMEEILSSPL